MVDFGDPTVTRAVEDMVVSATGPVVRGDAGHGLPWRLVDAVGADVTRWLIDLQASDYSPAMLRSYAYDLLSWLRFLAAAGIT